MTLQIAKSRQHRRGVVGVLCNPVSKILIRLSEGSGVNLILTLGAY